MGTISQALAIIRGAEADRYGFSIEPDDNDELNPLFALAVMFDSSPGQEE